MQLSSKITDKSRIEAFLRQDPLLHIYEIGDLDPFFWPHTTWHGVTEPNGRLAALTLLYTGMELPTFLALARTEVEALRWLVGKLKPGLPQRFYAHLSPEVDDVLQPHRQLDHKGRFLKMGLVDPGRVQTVSTTEVEQLTVRDQNELEAFYVSSYPGNWFDPRMLLTDQYFGIRDQGDLVCAVGIHVYSPEYGVAALGNIATRPDRRGRGHALSATARLCQSLLAAVDVIGLNVKADNEAAISCYQKLGFKVVAEYQELMVERGP